MQIYHPRTFTIAMPSQAELEQLLKIARANLFPSAPHLSPEDDRAFLASFTVAFSYISTLQRTTELKTRADLWIDRCWRWARERQGEQAEIGLSAFMCAIGAAGDIPFRLDLARWPHDIFVGLSWTEGPAATAEAWRHVLAARATRASVPPPKSLYPQPAPTITQLDMIHGMQAKPFE